MGHVNAVLFASERIFAMDGDFGLRLYDAELNEQLVEPVSF